MTGAISKDGYRELVARAAKRSRNQAEFRFQCALADYLRASALPEVYWTALPMGELRTKATGARLKRMGVKAGAPDLLLIVGGRVYGLELKRQRGAQSDSQEWTQFTWGRAGGTYAVARSMEEAVGLLIEWRVLPADFALKKPAKQLDMF